jgi:hypothetical protein
METRRGSTAWGVGQVREVALRRGFASGEETKQEVSRVVIAGRRIGFLYHGLACDSTCSAEWTGDTPSREEWPFPDGPPLATCAVKT